MFVKERIVVSNEKKEISVWERISKLWFMIGKMLLDGVRDPEKVAEILQAIVSEPAMAKKYLRRIFESELIAVHNADGTETFKSSQLFTGGVYGLTPPAVRKPTLDMSVFVYEQIVDGTFAEIFGSLGEERLRWQESQVVQFCRNHRDKLRTDGYGTFFELEGGFVANVNFDDNGRLKVNVNGFSFDGVWSALCGHRVVSPQQ